MLQKKHQLLKVKIFFGTQSMAECLMVNAVNHKENSGDPENYRLIRLLNINKVHGKLAKR